MSAPVQNMDGDLNTCRIERLAAPPALEFVAFAPAGITPEDPFWPSAPGGARFDAQHRPVLLHFAPRRWLAPDPDTDTRTRLAQAAHAGLGALIDVSGKWDAMRIVGPGATRLLAFDIAIGTVLSDRDCAAVTLFDCPATLVRAADGFALWIQSSYSRDFIACAERCRELLDSRR